MFERKKASRDKKSCSARVCIEKKLCCCDRRQVANFLIRSLIILPSFSNKKYHCNDTVLRCSLEIGFNLSTADHCAQKDSRLESNLQNHRRCMKYSGSWSAHES